MLSKTQPQVQFPMALVEYKTINNLKSIFQAKNKSDLTKSFRRYRIVAAIYRLMLNRIEKISPLKRKYSRLYMDKNQISIQLRGLRKSIGSRGV